MSRIDASSTAIGGVIQLYAYEPFSNVFVANTPPDTLRFTNSSVELISFLSNTQSNEVTFSSAGGFNRGYSTPLSLIIEDLCGTTLMETLSNRVNVGSGRFFPPAQGSVYSFFRNEPIVPQPFVAPIPVQNPITTPTLPAGLSLVRTGSNSFDLSGTPLVQLVASNYKVIGKGSLEPTKVVTVDVNIRVGAERLLMDVCGSTSLSLAVNTPVIPSVVTSRAPPYPSMGNNIRYTWPTLIDGLKFTDINGNVKTSGYIATDISSTLVLTGTPTENAARNTPAGITSTILTATRVSAPNISSNVTFSFAFGEQVLFGIPNVQSTFYIGAAVSSSFTSNSFFAFTKFATVDSSIAAIWAPDLVSDLSLNFVFADQRAYLTGTPVSASSGTYTVYASNANGTIGSLNPVSYSIVNDTITFISPTPTVDTCLNFIVSRSATNSKTGYYTAPIQFKAAAASGCNFIMSAPALSGTGLSLSNVGSNLYEITGIPLITTPLSVLTVDASSTVTSAKRDTSLNFAIVQDTFYFPDVSFTFIQNRTITPYKFDVSTNSERNVTGYSSTTLPSGILLSTSGLLSGTPNVNVDGSFTVVVSTGYTSGSKSYSYDIIPDTMLLLAEPIASSFPAGTGVDIQITGLTYSGRTVSNYAFSNFTPSYGVSINSVSGNISGTLTDSIPPNLLLPPLCNFQVNAQAGLLDGSLNATLTTTNPIEYRSYMTWFNSNGMSTVSIMYSRNNYATWSNVTTSLAGEQACGVFIKNTSIDSNVFLIPTTQGGSMFRSTDGVTFNLSANIGASYYISSVVNKPNTSTWWGIGNTGTNQNELFLFKSTDDGDSWAIDISINPMSDSNTWQGRFGSSSNYYTYYGAGGTIAYNDGVLMIGGGRWGFSPYHSMARSSNEGATWDPVSGNFQKEVGYYSLDVSGMWIVTGSDQYTTESPPTTVIPNNTIKYSSDMGLTWNNASGGFSMNGYDVVYGNGNWLAVGKDIQPSGYLPSLRWSSNGTNWTVVDLSTDVLFTPTTGSALPPYRIGPISFDGDRWNVVVLPDIFGNNYPRLYTHDVSTSLTNNWSVLDISDSFPDQNSALYGMTRRQYVRTGTPILANFTFESPPPNAVTFVSPTQTSYIFYQYMKIQPISFDAVGVGRVYYLMNTDDLPLGLTFDPLEQTITGTPMRTGENIITIYAKDDLGVTKLILYTNTIIPRIVKNQTSAGAYTSLIRQYTEVNGAQNARDRRALPTQNKNLGEFQSPYKSDAITQSNCPVCKP